MSLEMTENQDNLNILNIEDDLEQTENKKTDKELSSDISKSIAREKDEIPAGFWIRYTEPKWYVIHTRTGYEKKVKDSLEKLVENRNMQDLVLEIVIPTETVVEHKETGNKTREKRVFPSYVLVKMIVTNESWYLVRNAQGVTGFVGQGSEPIPLTDEEIRRLGIEKVEIELDIKAGDMVKVISGPFKGFAGVVEEVNAEKQILKTKVDMFGRDTPVELEFDQVDKLN